MKTALLNILFGFVIAALGLAVSVGSYAMVSRSGGHYYVAWGAVVVGVWRIAVGLYQLIRASFTAEGRASLWHLLWPREMRGWAIRLAVVVVAAAAIYLVGPEAWSTMSATPLATYAARGEVKSIAYSPDGTWLALGLGYGGVSIINARTGAAGVTPTLERYTDVEAVAFSPDGTMLATVAFNGLRIWTSTDWARATPGLVMSAKEGDYAVAFSPDGRAVATGSISNGLIMWDVQQRSPTWRSNAGHTVNGVAFSRDGRSVASGDDGGIQIWDAGSGKLQRRLRADGPEYLPFTTIAFLKGGLVAAGSYRKPNVSVWDSSSGALLRTVRSTGRFLGGGSVWSIDASPDGRWIVGAQSDGSVRFWDPQKDAPIRTIFGHKKDARAVAVSPDGTRIVSGGSDQLVKIYASP